MKDTITVSTPVGDLTAKGWRTGQEFAYPSIDVLVNGELAAVIEYDHVRGCARIHVFDRVLDTPIYSWDFSAPRRVTMEDYITEGDREKLRHIRAHLDYITQGQCKGESDYFNSVYCVKYWAHHLGECVCNRIEARVADKEGTPYDPAS